MPQSSPLCFSFLPLLLFSVLIPPAQSSLTLLNTTLEDATFYSVMPSAKFDHFPEHPFIGKLIPIKFLSGCELAPVPSFGGTPLVGIVTMRDAMEAGCVRVYHVAKGLQKNAAFVGLIVNTGASNTNNWFLNRDPFKDISDLVFAATEIDEATWKAIEPYVPAPGEGDTWVSVGQDLSPFIAAYEEPSSQGIRFSLLALWALAGVLISAQIVVQNKEEWNFNTSAKVLFLSVYTCVCNVIYQAADPWGLMVERSLFVLPLFLSSLGAIYLCYAITVFKWVKIFNVFGHKSHFFKIRRPLVGVIICFTILLMGGTFFAIYFGFASMSLVLTTIFVCITPFQITVFAVYGFKVTKSLSRSVDTTRSIEMRLARIRMFSLTVVAMLVWVFAFVVSVVTAVLGDGRDPNQKKLTQVLINVFFLLGVLSISATYAFAFYSRSLLGGSSHHDSSTGGTHPVNNSATATRRSVDRRGSTSTHQEDCDGSQITVPMSPMSPMSTIKEYQIGDMAVEL